MAEAEPILATAVEATSTLGTGDAEETALEDLFTPERIGPYDILDRLGQGGMSVVFAATHREQGSRVAIKVVRTPSEMNLGALRREIHGLSRIDHPKVVPVIDSGIHQGRPWFAMPLIEGPTLRLRLRELWANPDAGSEARWEAQTQVESPPDSGAEFQLESEAHAGPAATAELGPLEDRPGAVASERPPPPAARPPAAAGALEELLGVFHSLCETLAYIHGRGLVHRDLKPENVILAEGKGPTLVDFGLIARFGAREGRESVEGEYALAGTPGYMAPEQILQELVDARTDLYALGCMLYEALTNRRPFGDARGLDLVQRQLYESPSAPSEWVRGISPELDALVLRLLARNPQGRVGHAADAAEILRRQLGRPAAEVEAVDVQYLYRPTLAGRLHTLTELEGLLSRAEKGEGRVALLVGRSGIGKTRLAVELMASAARRRTKVYQGACLPLGAADSSTSGRLQGAPLQPFRGLLRALADHCRRHGTRATETYLGDALAVLRVYAPELADVPGAEFHDEAVGLSGEAAQRRVMQALVKVMNAFAEDEPFLLVLDDVQWADPLTLDVLAAIGEGDLALRHAMILCTGRSESTREEFVKLRRNAGIAVTELETLDAEAVASIVEDMLASEAVPRAFTDYLSRASDGNPFFVAEYLRTAVEDRLLRREITGEWVLAAHVDSSASGRLESLPLPDSVEALVLRRVVQLDARSRRVLDAAAVIGSEIEAELVAEVLDCSVDELYDPLAELMSHAVLRSEDDGTVAFSHQKVRELTYGELPDQTRRALHRRAAEALETRSEDPAVLPLLATHWYAAEVPDRAFEALDRAGQAALAAYAPTSAVPFFEKALALIQADKGARARVEVDSYTRARLHRDYGWARYCNGDVSGFLDHSHRALDHLGLGTPESKLGWAWAATSHLAKHLGAYVVPSRWLVAKMRHRRRRLELGAETASALSWGYIYGNSPPRALGLSLIAANLSARAGARGPRAIPYTMLGATLGSLGLGRAADRYFSVARQSAGEVREVGQAFVQAWIEGIHHYNFARWQRGDAMVFEVLERGRKAGDAHAVINSLTIASIGAYHRGDLRRSYDYADEARELARANHYLVLETVTRCQVAVVHMHRGAFDRAAAMLADREDEDPEVEGVMTLISRRSIQAGALWHLDQPGPALEAAEEAVRLLEQNPAGNMTSVMAHLWLPAVYMRVLAERPVGDPGTHDLLARARQTLGWAQRFGRMYPIGRPIADRHRATFDAWMGDERRAERLQARAAETARRLGMHEEFRLARVGAAAPGESMR